MAKLRKDSFTERKPKCERGRGTFHGVHRHTGIHIGEQPVAFSAPINSLYGTNVEFGDEAKERQKNKK